MPEESITAFEERRARRCRELATIGEMRSGSLMASPDALISMLFLCCGGIEPAPPLPTRI